MAQSGHISVVTHREKPGSLLVKVTNEKPLPNGATLVEFDSPDVVGGKAAVESPPFKVEQSPLPMADGVVYDVNKAITGRG